MLISTISMKFVTPVLMSFFAMSFCDVVGVPIFSAKSKA